MTRFSCDKLLDIDPEIERTFRALRIQEKISEDSGSSLSSSDTPMADHSRTMKELAAPDEAFKYSCITYPTLAAPTRLNLTQGGSSNASNSDAQQARLEELMQQILQQQQNQERQIGQLASSINQIQAQGSSQLPSQTILNPKGNVSALTLRSGRKVSESARGRAAVENFPEIQPSSSSNEEFSEMQNVPTSSSTPIYIDPMDMEHEQGRNSCILEISSKFSQNGVQPRKNVEEEKAKEFQELVDLFSKVASGGISSGIGNDIDINGAKQFQAKLKNVNSEVVHDNHKCKLLHWCGEGVVAEGRVASTDPKAKVHHIPLGGSCWKWKRRKGDLISKVDFSKPVQFVSTGTVMPSQEVKRDPQEEGDRSIGVLSFGHGLGYGLGFQSNRKDIKDDEEEDNFLPTTFGRRIKGV
ncbi:hypothetical protein ZIOFF_005773 [Zingiber officinale]|uniref:Uncharacterized protein n=1 Tax=Zingiber officinale TaxID=94328 RepID=A0A8J5HNV8_ZINOF|nr:hypothetical protein ZIOFF_005773 [Zingiber officinale]